ncbi:MAG: formate dehydrogenase, partial [Firmicutes bacterium]|nr:formate dehydrogenase [Bacillota bacterium]
AMEPKSVPKYRNYHDFIQFWETAPGSGVGLLAGFRGSEAEKILVGEPNRNQLQAYADHHAFWFHRLDPAQQYYRMTNQAYLQWAQQMKFIDRADPIVLHFYSEVMQTFRLAGQGLWPGKKPTAPALKKRVATYFDPLPTWYPPFEDQLADSERFPFRIITQRPMTHYHSWGSQNAWLRQLLNENPIFMNPRAAEANGLHDGMWVWIESRLGKMTGVLRYSDAVEPTTVWTWNAVAKQAGSWGLDPKAPEANRAILINHIIPDTLPTEEGLGTLFNNDPITGQASWYDTRVRIYPSERHDVWPTVPPRVPKDPDRARTPWLKYDASVPEGSSRAGRH